MKTEIIQKIEALRNINKALDIDKARFDLQSVLQGNLKTISHEFQTFNSQFFYEDVFIVNHLIFFSNSLRLVAWSSFLAILKSRVKQGMISACKISIKFCEQPIQR